MARDIGRSKGKFVCDDYSDEDDDHESGDLGLEEDIGISLEKLNLGPKKKLLVLGFGGFLCFRVNLCDQKNIPTFRRHDASYGNNLIYKRSHFEGFMKFCLERFHVAIWSSANEYNLNKTLECIMEEFKSKLLFAWGQEKCTDTGFGSLEKKDKPLFLKELKKVWENNNASLPKCEDKFDFSNTLLIDDKPYKALLNPVHNGIFPDQHKVSDPKEEALGPKSELRRYLEKLAEADDVPSFVKENPFGQMAITSKHPDWNYYSKVVSKSQKTTAWVVRGKVAKRSTNNKDDK